jgi:FkbM family methyltransferase
MNEFDRWFADGGDEKYRYNYSLNENSLVFDLGGYEGKFTDRIYHKYKCNIYVFEPMRKYYESLCSTLSFIDKIKIYDFGFSDKTETIKIFHSNDASSLHKISNSYESIKVQKISDFIINNNITKVDLLKINIEGSEFEVLNDLIENKLLDIFENIQVQFHEFVDDAASKRNKIREHLRKNHSETFLYEFVWENWKKNNNI